MFTNISPLSIVVNPITNSVLFIHIDIVITLLKMRLRFAILSGIAILCGKLWEKSF
ncbi:MAG: hypothetical protein HYU80_00055 [Candidatus Blackburnbacteria bacterium]|nr:hypothetical protein [Candidatus Blackburnbacteria bacterium]